MIEVKHLTRRYGAALAVDDLSFTVPDGLCYGLLGANGAGKSTTMNVLTGCLAPTAGTVAIDGHDLLEEPQAAKASLGYLPELPPLYPDMTVREYLLFVSELKGARKKAERRAEIRAVMERTGTAEVAPRLIRNLSKGYRQRVGLAAALVGSPRTIILDEPTVGLDPAQRIAVRELIRELAKTHTVVLSSHILSEVQAVCDRVLILAGGKLAAEGSPEELAERMTGAALLVIGCRGEAPQALAAVQGIPGVEAVQVQDGGALGEVCLSVRCQPGQDPRAALSEALAKAGCPVVSMAREEGSLEEVFLALTEEAGDEEERRTEQEDEG